MTFLSEHMDRLAASVLAQAQRARAGSGHAGLKGAAIEVILRNLLNQYLPKTFGVGTGQVANSSGALSPQVDVLVMDTAVFPRLAVNEDGSVIVCVESVYSVVEVKAEWDAAKVADHFGRFRDVEAGRLDPWANEVPAAYFAFALDSIAVPKLAALEDDSRAVGVYSLAGRRAWHSPRGSVAFKPAEGNGLEMFLHNALQDSMEKGQREVGTYGESYRIVASYFGWP